MTEIPAEVFEAVARDALRDLATNPDARALEALAGCDVLIPAVSGIRYTRDHSEFVRFVLPVVESVNDAPAVMVFTSEERLLRAFPCVPCYRQAALECQSGPAFPGEPAGVVHTHGRPGDDLLCEQQVILAERLPRPVP